MNQPVLGIIGGGQLGSMLSEAAKKVDIKTVVLSDDPDAPAKNFTNKFIYGKYHDTKIITEFGGITGGYPLSPYAKSEGIIKVALAPSFNKVKPSVKPFTSGVLPRTTSKG